MTLLFALYGIRRSLVAFPGPIVTFQGVAWGLTQRFLCASKRLSVKGGDLRGSFRRQAVLPSTSWIHPPRTGLFTADSLVLQPAARPLIQRPQQQWGRQWTYRAPRPYP